VLEDSRVSDVRRGSGSCVSPRAGAVLRRNRLLDCSIGIGFFDNFRAGGAQTLEVTANTISRTDTSAMYVDTVGLSPYTSARHRLVLVMRRNRIDASGRNGKTIHGNGIAVHAPAHGSAVSVVSTGNQITGHIQESQALFAVFYNVQRWPRGSTYRAAQNGYYDLNRRGQTRFSVPGIRWPYRLREFSAALAAAGWREAQSRVGR
jgi:hypothetical protein